MKHEEDLDLIVSDFSISLLNISFCMITLYELKTIGNMLKSIDIISFAPK